MLREVRSRNISLQVAEKPSSGAESSVPSAVPAGPTDVSVLSTVQSKAVASTPLVVTVPVQSLVIFYASLLSRTLLEQDKARRICSICDLARVHLKYLVPLMKLLMPSSQPLLKLISNITAPPFSLIQWNCRGIRNNSTEMFRYLKESPADIICLQETFEAWQLLVVSRIFSPSS